MWEAILEIWVQGWGIIEVLLSDQPFDSIEECRAALAGLETDIKTMHAEVTRNCTSK